MYINDVIRQVKRFYPSEYEEPEMYIWCNEVSAMLMIEDRNVFREIYLPTDGTGTALLPEHVRLENIEIVESDGHRLEKKDIIAHGGRLSCGAPCNGELRIVYIEPYRPIRLTRYRGEAVIDSNNSCIRAGACEFVAGDTLDVYSVSNDGARELIAGDLPLMAVSFDVEGAHMYVLRVPEGAIAQSADGVCDCVIMRHVTDKTVCAEPYDSMYIDYILAKINLYQRDIEAYNRHMTAFNSRLGAYKRWLINRMPAHGGILENWW